VQRRGTKKDALMLPRLFPSVSLFIHKILPSSNEYLGAKENHIFGVSRSLSYLT